MEILLPPSSLHLFSPSLPLPTSIPARVTKEMTQGKGGRGRKERLGVWEGKGRRRGRGRKGKGGQVVIPFLPPSLPPPPLSPSNTNIHIHIHHLLSSPPARYLMFDVGGDGGSVLVENNVDDGWINGWWMRIRMKACGVDEEVGVWVDE